MSNPEHEPEQRSPQEHEQELAELLKEVRALRRAIDDLRAGTAGTDGSAGLSPDYDVLVRSQPELQRSYEVLVRTVPTFQPPSYDVLVRAVDESEEPPGEEQ